MAEEQNTALPAKFDPDTRYRIQLAKSVPFGGRMLSPGKSQTVTGEVAESFRDAIASAEAITDGDG